jgi:serine beta-lactamase-like protein LACTB
MARGLFSLRLLSLSILLAHAPAIHAQPTTPPTDQYATVARALEGLIQHEMADKGLPAVSIALVDDQAIVWAAGFGYADARRTRPATADTVYRVGSVSKLFTDIGVMQLVERGELELDAPVERYLPGFRPKNTSGKPITLRQLMTHRSGLIREPPAGHYFDDTGTSLGDTVRSLNGVPLTYPPETKIKYSNAAIAVVGYTLESTQQEPFDRYLQRAVLDPLGLKKSAFEPRPEIKPDIAEAVMWSYQGRTFPAPTFELGMAPAGSMNSTVNDLGRFMSMLFNGGKGPNGRVLKKETLDQMLKPQFPGPDGKSGFGIGFALGELDGKRRIGHGGAIYGFATELAFLPDEKLGVVVVCSKDVANAVMERIADHALRSMLAVNAGKPLPKIEETTRLKPEIARQLAGRYVSEDRIVHLDDYNGRLFFWPARGGYRYELRAAGDGLITDDVTGFGVKIEPQGDGIKVGDRVYKKAPEAKPQAPKGEWLGLIGEYGWDHNILYILERDQKLYALIEWFFLYPLEEESENVFRFPDHGLYHGEKLIFKRNAEGKATQVVAANVVFKRRHLDGEDGRTFRIQPRRPLDELRREALAATPPTEGGEFARNDLVELIRLDDTLKLDVRYATTNNFLSTPFYQSARAFLQRPAAEALVRVHKKLAGQGYGLLIHDGYRPWSVTKMFWDATPDEQHIFVANPAQGSRHNRGCAVDLTLFDLKTGKPVEMVGGYDEMSDRSYPLYVGGTSQQRWHRELLRRAMEAEGFSVYEAEWWHFDYKDWRKYAIQNVTFEELK